MKPTVLGPVRHQCMACGGGCHGTDVLVADDERELLVQRAAELGEVVPFDGSFLRKDRGRCVFLDDAQRCRIHARFGLEAKPLVCQQYPLFARQVGIEVRLAVDPGCMHAWQSWQTGPEVPDGTRIYRSRGGQPMQWNAEEQALLTLINPKRRSVADITEALGAAGLVARLAERLVASRIGERVQHPETAQSLRDALSGVSAVLAELDPTSPPALSIPPDLDAWTVETLRRVVWLRFPADARPVARALGVLAGAIAAGWAHPDPAQYGPALAAWTRVIRTPARLSLWADDEALAATLHPESLPS